jgi:hypothetical protein
MASLTSLGVPLMLADPTDVALGILTLFVPVLILASALVLILRLSSRGDLRRGLGYLFLLPNRRDVLIRLIIGTVSVFLLAGVLNALTLLDVLPEMASDYGIALADIAASGMLFMLLYIGLRPTAITDAEKSALSREPMAFAALGLVQSMQDSEP